MKWIFVLLFTCVGNSDVQWHTDLAAATKAAQAGNRLILLNFSGSDWCGPCMRLKEEVFNSEAFGQLASSQLVLCNADFPRSKKNQLPKAQQQSNEALADRYNPQGKFPYTLLLDTAGKVLKSWDGYPSSNQQLFIDQLKAACNAYRH